MQARRMPTWCMIQPTWHVPIQLDCPARCLQPLQASGRGVATCGCRVCPRSAPRCAQCWPLLGLPYTSKCAMCSRHMFTLLCPSAPTTPPQEVADLISQCMALEPSERPTAQQLMQRLQEVPKRGTAVQQPPSPRARDVPSLRQSTSPAVTGEGLSSL